MTNELNKSPPSYTPGPYRLIRYTDVNENRVVRAFSEEEYEALDDPADFMNPVTLCADLPMPFAAALELLEALEKLTEGVEHIMGDTIGTINARAAIAKARGQA